MKYVTLICKGCGISFERKEKAHRDSISRYGTGVGTYCSIKCANLNLKTNGTKAAKKILSDTWEERFFGNISYIDGQGPDGSCWEWSGDRSEDGYGRFTSPKYNTVQAHRMSYILHIGDFNRKLLVCHTCDNPPCVNPAHLFLGTHWDNAKDKVNKGRQLKTSSKLTEEMVIEIRKLYDTNTYVQRTLADMYGVSIYAIADIIKRNSWKDVP